MNANEPFVKARGLDRPELTRYQYGGTLGGKIIRDKFFFFGSYQGTKERNALSLKLLPIYLKKLLEVPNVRKIEKRNWRNKI